MHKKCKEILAELSKKGDIVFYDDFKFPVPFKLETRLKDILEDEVDKKYLLSENSINRLNKSSRSILPGDKNTEYANCLIAQYNKIPTDGFYVKVKQGTKKGYDVAGPGDSINISFPTSLTKRGRVGKQVSQTLDCNCSQLVNDGLKLRKLTPRECFRLQGVKDKDINLVVSDTNLYKIAGNAISVNVMQHLLRSLYKQEKTKESLFDFMGI